MNPRRSGAATVLLWAQKSLQLAQAVLRVPSQVVVRLSSTDSFRIVYDYVILSHFVYSLCSGQETSGNSLYRFLASLYLWVNSIMMSYGHLYSVFLMWEWVKPCY